ncbi:ATP-binding protein [Cupriavidus plantarum]|uniref:ATP-binding protein n=1 Tax=Cupriavidus plantarum TaxID=942865 RepID=UPI000E22278D|nr:ATP-binding protein [Cupriavidus plantarum]REE85477.1 two-component system osmolarity sensor histidine kinase EnvZ [Cupriavidus plantarum]
MRLLPRSLLARNIALLVALVAFTQACSLTVLLHFVQRPRIERAATIFADYVRTLDTVLVSMPRDAGLDVAARLNAQTQVPGETAPHGQGLAHFFGTWQRETFVRALRAQLPPDMPVRWQSGEIERLWIRLHVAGEPRWVSLPMTADAQASGITTTLFLSLGLALLAALTGLLLQRYLNRPLQTLASAARELSAGRTPPPQPTDGPTEIAQVSHAFNQMLQSLQQAEATRALMLAGISHDIRTPLTKLRLAMAMSLPRGAGDGFVSSAEGYLDQIDTILQQFMDYAGSGEREAPEPGDLNGLIGQLASDFAGLGHDFDLTLGDLPPVPFRPISMMRLLMNLMQNAIVYGKSGFAVRTWREDGIAYVAVGDRGSGISPEALERLKEPFSRGDNARTQTKGTGLGLAIVDRIARLHGGTLRFRAREGGGMEAVVALPAP